MHTQFPGRITSVGANLVQGEINVTLHTKMSDVDADTIDRLAEYCELEMLGYIHIESDRAPAISLPGLVKSFTGDYASRIIKTGLRIHRREVTPEIESLLVQICRMGWECSVEVSSRQPTLPGLEKVTIEGNGKKVELR